MSNYFPFEDLQVFSPEEALQYLGEEMMPTIVDSFLENLEGTALSLINHYKSSDWQVIGSTENIDFARKAHSLKGSCRYLCLKKLIHILEILQFAIRDGKVLQVATSLDQALEQLEVVQVYLLRHQGKPIEIVTFPRVTHLHDIGEKATINHRLVYHSHASKDSISLMGKQSELVYKPLHQQVILKQNDAFCQIF